MLQAEVAFSLHQMNKVLTYMGVDYIDLINGNGHIKFKEETNVFCYYVLKTLILFYWSDFVGDYCGGSFKFRGDIDTFIDFVREKYKESAFMNAAITSEYVRGSSMRMTLWEN